MKTNGFRFLFCAALAAMGGTCLLTRGVSAEAPYTTTWIQQFGTSGWDSGEGVSADDLGNIYVSGLTQGSLGGINAGGYDAFISKYSATGNLIWARQIGSATHDRSYGVSADGLGNVYISGSTAGSLGGASAGSYDAFVSKYDAAGNLTWTKQIGSTNFDVSYGVSADGLGSVFISGYTTGSLAGPSAGGNDAFISKYDAAGNLAWSRQLGSAVVDFSYGVSADGSGNVYIAGTTEGSMGGANAGSTDAFVSKYDASGNLAWTKQLGSTGSDNSYGISVDGLGNVYISGETYSSLDGANAGGYDAFVSKYSAAGDLAWTRQLGTISWDSSQSVSADPQGNVYISGYTSGSLGGPKAGGTDAFISKYDTTGNLLWTQQLGSADYDYSYGVSADALGNVYISGETLGSLVGMSAGSYDAFVARLSPVPEPATLTLALAGVLGAYGLRRRKAEGEARGLRFEARGFGCGI